MTKERIQARYTSPIFLSLLMHAVILSLFLLQLNFPDKQLAAAQPVNIVKAVVVNQQQIEQEVSRLQQKEESEKMKELSEKNELQKQTEELNKKREIEQKKIEELRNELKAQNQQRLIEEKAQAQKLQQLKEQQKQEQLRLDKLKQEQISVEKQRKQQVEELQKIKKQQKEQTLSKPTAEKKSPQKNITQKHNQEMEEMLKVAEKEDAERTAAVNAKKKSSQQTDKLKQQQALNEKIQELSNTDLSQLQGEIDKYKRLMLQAIGRRWLIPENADRALSCKLHIKLAIDGTVLAVKIIQSSGDTLLDRSAVVAVKKASPLPMPDKADLRSEFTEINLTVRPEGLLSGG